MVSSLIVRFSSGSGSISKVSGNFEVISIELGGSRSMGGISGCSDLISVIFKPI